MNERPTTWYQYIYSGRIATLAVKIAELEDEFKLCLSLGHTDRAAFIECALGESYKSLMHEVKKQGLLTIDVTNSKVKVTYTRQFKTNSNPTANQ